MAHKRMENRQGLWLMRTLWEQASDIVVTVHRKLGRGSPHALGEELPKEIGERASVFDIDV